MAAASIDGRRGAAEHSFQHRALHQNYPSLKELLPIQAPVFACPPLALLYSHWLSALRVELGLRYVSQLAGEYWHPLRPCRASLRAVLAFRCRSALMRRFSSG